MKLIGFIKYLFTHYPKRIPVLLVLLTISGLLESIGIGAVIPVLEFFFQEKSFVATSPISLFFYNVLNILHFPVSLRSLFGLIIVIFAIKSTITFIQQWFLELMIAYFQHKKSNELMTVIMNAEWSYSKQKRIGALTNLFAIEMQNFLLAIRYSIIILTEVTLFLFYLGLSCLISIPLTALMIGFLSLSIFPIKLLNRYVHSFSQQNLTARDNLYNRLQQLISGIKFIKSSGYTQKSCLLFEKDIKTTVNLGYKTGVLSGVLPSFFILFSIISLSAIAFLSLVTFQLPFSYFLLITLIFYRLYPKFQNVQTIYQYFIKSLPSIEILSDTSNDFTRHHDAYGQHPFTSLTKQIHFNNICFTHDNENSFSIHNLDFTVRPHEFIGIVGPSGCGKTTLIDLLTGVLKPTKGSIIIDDVPLNQYDLQHYRQYISLVSQDTFLFNESILNNLTWGQENVSNDRITDACKQANILSFIDTLPNGLDTLIGERGLQLSGGQRQRLSLARALLKKPSILILDEATSALDAESESEIQKSIYALKGQITLIIISHRLATVKTADRIIVMDKGTIIQQGNWEDLSKQEGLFKLFKELQILS